MENNGLDRNVVFMLNDVYFEYDEEKNKKNIRKHGLPLSMGARVFFDMDRIEASDEAHSDGEQRYDVIGSASIGVYKGDHRAWNVEDDLLLVVYTERELIMRNQEEIEVIRLISVRLANSFERGVYYANQR